MTARLGRGAGSSRAEASLLVGVAVAAVLCTASAVQAAGLRDMEDGWLLPAARLAQLLADSLVGASPAAIQSGCWVTSGQGRLFGMDELPLVRLAAGRQSDRIRLAGSWERLGGDLYGEDTWRLGVSLGRRKRWTVEGGWDRVRISTLSAEGRPFVGIGWSGPVWAGGVIEVDWPLSAPPPWHSSRGRRRWLRLSGTSGGCGWVLAADRDGRGAPWLQLGLFTRLSARAGIGLRADPGTGSLGVTSAWRLGRALLRSSHLIHPDLGITHRWSLAWGRWGHAW